MFISYRGSLASEPALPDVAAAFFAVTPNGRWASPCVFRREVRHV